MNQHGEPLPPDSPDATLRALGLLETPAVRVEDRDTFHAHERGVQETAAAVWLAVSPLRAAPPEILENIHARCGIRPSGQAEPRRFHGLRRALMAGGWAAAVVACAGWWRAASGSYGSPDAAQAANAQTGTPKLSPGAPGKGRPDGDSPLSVGRPHRAPSTTAGTAKSADDLRLRGELNRLRLLVAEADTPRPGEARPRVRELRPPGAAPRSPKAASARVTAALTAALERTMREESGQKEASLVIEDGWVNGGGLELPEDGTVLHRRFPAEEWAARGLWKAEDGRFYDPAGGLVWSPGSGKKEYIGKRAGSQDDLTAFSSPPPTPDPALAATTVADEPPPATVAARDGAQAQSGALPAEAAPPEGYVVEDPASGDATLLVQNLPEPQPGMENVALVTSAVDGSRSIITLTFADGAWNWVSSKPGQSGGMITVDGALATLDPAYLSRDRASFWTGFSSMTLPAGGFTDLQVVTAPVGYTFTTSSGLPPGSTVLLSAGQ